MSDFERALPKEDLCHCCLENFDTFVNFARDAFVTATRTAASTNQITQPMRKDLQLVCLERSALKAFGVLVADKSVGRRSDQTAGGAKSIMDSPSYACCKVQNLSLEK